VLELTYNYGRTDYTKGNGYAQVCVKLLTDVTLYIQQKHVVCEGVGITKHIPCPPHPTPPQKHPTVCLFPPPPSPRSTPKHTVCPQPPPNPRPCPPPPPLPPTPAPAPHPRPPPPPLPPHPHIQTYTHPPA
jgi:hypothetical protein